MNDSFLPDTHRVLPHSADAERGVLSSILLDPKTVFGLCSDSGITEEQFHYPAHAILFKTLFELWNAAKPIDIILLTQTLSNKGLLDHVGGPAYVTELLSFVPTAANASHYLEILQEKFKRREIIAKGTEMAARSYEDSENIADIEAFAQNSLLKLTLATGKGEHSRTMRENVTRAICRLEDMVHGKVKPGLATGLTDLDEKLGGFHAGEVTILMGGTGGGKTSLAHNIADHVAVELRKGVMIFSYEMNALWVTNRMIAARARINTEAIRTARFCDSDFSRWTAIQERLGNAPIFIEDNADMDIEGIRSRARRRLATDDLGLIVIDYLQKIPSRSKKQGSRQREVAEISDGIQKMAMELNLPVLALAQHNEDGEVREARDIAFDAKTVLKIKRDDSIDIESEGVVAPRDIVICKNNNGSIGRVPVTFLKQFVKFVNSEK